METTKRPRGRPKGSQNVATAAVRQVINAFLDNNADQVQELFRKLAEENPGKALDIYFSAAEYITPKLARVEQKTEHSGQVNHGFIVIPAKDSLEPDA